MSKDLLKSLVPPALANLVRRRSSVWSGVYRTFSEIPGTGPGFDGDSWIREIRSGREAAERLLHSGGPSGPFDENDLLGPLAAFVAMENVGRVRIVEFGGGGGLTYLRLQSTLKGQPTLDYHIVESAAVCDDGRLHFSGDPRIHYHPRLEGAVSEADIVYVRTALQYVEDYRGVLGSLLALGPRFVLLTSFSGTERPTFATAQVNHPGSKIPYLFINVQELSGWMKQQGYPLAWETRIEKSYPQGGLPPDHRMTHVYNFMFVRAS